MLLGTDFETFDKPGINLLNISIYFFLNDSGAGTRWYIVTITKS
jgi:hypothetical protein